MREQGLGDELFFLRFARPLAALARPGLRRRKLGARELGYGAVPMRASPFLQASTALLFSFPLLVQALRLFRLTVWMQTST